MPLRECYFGAGNDTPDPSARSRANVRDKAAMVGKPLDNIVVVAFEQAVAARIARAAWPMPVPA